MIKQANLCNYDSSVRHRQTAIQGSQGTQSCLCVAAAHEDGLRISDSALR